MSSQAVRVPSKPYFQSPALTLCSALDRSLFTCVRDSVGAVGAQTSKECFPGEGTQQAEPCCPLAAVGLTSGRSTSEAFLRTGRNFKGLSSLTWTLLQKQTLLSSACRLANGTYATQFGERASLKPASSVMDTVRQELER